VISSIALVVASGALIWAVFFRNAPAQPGTPQPIMAVQGLHLDAGKVTHVSGKGRVAIVEFSDFQCPYCAKHAKDTLPAIKRDLVASGNVRYVALHYPIEELHPRALQASEASECAGKQNRFWEMHERLFSEPSALTRADFIRDAEAVSLDVGAFVQCLDSHETLDKIRGDQAEGRRLGVRGTPAFFIGKVRADGGIDLVTRISGAAPAEVFAEQIAALGS
jgi:protein-disulfide isomerase